MLLDTLIRNVTIVDGTGRPGFPGSVGIRDGRLEVFPADGAGEAPARTVVEGGGLTLCPGFIDSHSHDDLVLDPDAERFHLCKISQGVTTQVAGQCGLSPFPVLPGDLETVRRQFGSYETEEQLGRLAAFTGFRPFLAWARTVPKACNFAFLCGHSMLRFAAMGTADRPASPEELGWMEALLEEAMQNGCLGMSSGLVYVPGVYSDTRELTALCRVAAKYGGVYATHMRNEAGRVVEAVREAVSIAETAGVPLFVSHHKVMGKDNWGLSAQTLGLLHEAAGRGVRVTLDQYPYLATQTLLNVCLPPDLFAAGRPALLQKLRDPAERRRIAARMRQRPAPYSNNYLNAGGFGGILVLSSPRVKEAEGLTVAAYAEKCGKSGFDAYFDLLVQNELDGLAAYFSIGEEEMQRIYLDENTVVGSDGLASAAGPVHPRTYGTFARALAYFAGEKRLLPFEKAVYKQTGLTAERWGLRGKGRIAPGFDADLVLLDRSELRDTADYANGRSVARGIRAVFVGGEAVYRDGGLTGARPGKCILRGQP